MADSSRDVIINILTKYVGADQAQMAAADIEKVTQNSEGLGKQFDETGEKTVEFGKRGREMHMLFAELNRVVPGLGEALRGLNILGFNPLIATLSLVAFGFYEAKKAISDWNKEMDDAAAAAADPTFLNGINAKIEVLNAATEAATKYAQKEAEVSLHEQSISTALQDQLQLMAAIEQARGQQTQAQKALALAKIGMAEAGGQITPSKAIEERATVETQFTQREFEEQHQAQLNKLQTDQIHLAVAQLSQKLLDGVKASADLAATAAEVKFNQAKADSEKFKSDEDRKKFLKPYQDAITEAQDQVNSAQKNIRATTISGVPGTGPSKIQQDTLDHANRLLALAEKGMQAGEEHIRRVQSESSPTAKLHLDAIKGTAGLADKKADENLDAIQKLQGQIDQLSRVLAATGPLGAQTQQTKLQTIQTTESTELEKQAAADIEKYRSSYSKGNLQGALDALRDLNDALAGHAEILQYVQGLGINVAKLKEAIADLKIQSKRNYSAATLP